MKNLIITAILVVAATTTGFAQMGTGVDGTFNSHATVLSTLSVTNNNDLDFFNVIQGVDKTVEANPGTGLVDATYGTGQLADFVVSGSSGKEVGAYLTTLDDLTNGTDDITLANWVGWSNTTNSISGATAYTDPTNWTNRIDVVLDGSGNGYMWLGATAQPAAAQVAGEYNVTNTLTFYYTGN